LAFPQEFPLPLTCWPLVRYRQERERYRRLGSRFSASCTSGGDGTGVNPNWMTLSRWRKNAAGNSCISRRARKGFWWGLNSGWRGSEPDSTAFAARTCFAKFGSFVASNCPSGEGAVRYWPTVCSLRIPECRTRAPHRLVRAEGLPPPRQSMRAGCLPAPHRLAQAARPLAAPPSVIPAPAMRFPLCDSAQLYDPSPFPVVAANAPQESQPGQW
jgi:hypothetical protein